MSARSPFSISCAILLGTICLSHAQTVVIDDFEVDEGHFTQSPSFSGTTTGETETAPGVGPSTADRIDTEAFTGSASQTIFLDDSPVADVPLLDPPQAWRLRHLSGGGSVANNLTLQNTAEGYVGFYLMTTTPNLLASIMLDDGLAPALERARYIPIIDDGEWHLYEWQFANPDDWEPFALAEANGQIDSAAVTIDSIFISALKDTNIPDQDATFFIDTVSFNPTGQIVIPEPSSILLTGVAAVGVLGLRRRRG